MFRRLTSLLCLLLCLALAIPAMAESAVIDLIANPDASYSFRPDVPILEIFYPRVYSSDCTVLRCDGHVMLIDGSTVHQSRRRVLPMLQDLGIDHVELALNTHPHKDHLPGLARLYEKGITIDRVLMGTNCGANDSVLDEYVDFFAKAGVPVDFAEDGQVLTLGPAELTLFMRSVGNHNLNDESACALIRYGERTLISLADVERRSMKRLVTEPPACGLDADIMKYPHHGKTQMNDDLYAMVDPELVIICTMDGTNGGKGMKYAQRHDTPAYTTEIGPLRLRTDGVIWVLDTYPEYRSLADDD